MTIRSILVATDLTSRESLAVQRAWQVAKAHGATVKLIKADRLEDAAAEAAGIDLLVVPDRSERSLRAFLLGQQVMRLLRSCGCPVLVARQLRGSHHERILVAADLSARSQALVEFAGAFEPRAQLEIFHAISTLEEAKLRSAEATEQAIRAYRERCRQRAREGMQALAATLDGAGTRRVDTAVGRGDAGIQAAIRQEESGADLVVIGRTPASAWEDFLCGSAAQRVLRWSSGDVLVVPHAVLEHAAAAGLRMAPGTRARTAARVTTTVVS